MRLGSLTLALGLPALAAAAMLVPGCAWQENEPNVLVVVVDNLRADAVRSGPRIPNINRLKQRGLVFRTCFSHTPSTTGGAAALFSGRLPHETGISVDGRTVDDSVPLLAETLALEGYLAFGAVGVPGLRPDNHGAGVTRGFAAFAAPADGVEPPARTNERLLGLLDGAEEERPWLLYAHYALSDATEPSETDQSGRLDPSERSEARREYFADIERADRALGSLLNELRERNAYDNTLVVLTANHGASLGQHADDDQRGGLYDEVLRVPLVIKLPKNHTAAADLRRATNVLARVVDITPTVLDVLDMDALPSVAGRTLIDETERELTAEIRPPLAPTPRYARRNDRYKLIYAPAEERFEMYDLSRDPLELDNVFAVEGHLWSAWQDDLRAIAESDFGYTEESDRGSTVVSQRAQILGN